MDKIGEVHGYYCGNCTDYTRTINLSHGYIEKSIKCMCGSPTVWDDLPTNEPVTKAWVRPNRQYYYFYNQETRNYILNGGLVLVPLINKSIVNHDLTDPSINKEEFKGMCERWYNDKPEIQK